MADPSVSFPSPAYDVGDIIVELHVKEPRHWLITDLYFNEMMDQYSYHLDDMSRDDYWELSKIIDKWYRRVA